MGESCVGDWDHDNLWDHLRTAFSRVGKGGRRAERNFNGANGRTNEGEKETERGQTQQNGERYNLGNSHKKASCGSIYA